MAGSDRPRAPPRPAERPKTNGCAVLEPPQRPPPALSAEKDGPGTAPLLVVIYAAPGPLLGRRFVLDHSPVLVGRGVENDIVLEDASVSRQHAHLEGRDATWWCVDSASTDGVYIDDRRATGRAPLAHGTRIGIGSTIFKFLCGSRLEELYHEEIYRLTVCDGLTQAYRQRYLIEALDKEIVRSRRRGSALALLMIEVDELAAIAQPRGLLNEGDRVLREVAGVLRRSVPREGILARYGDKRFVIVLPESAPEAVRAVAESLCERVANSRLEVGNRELQATICIGGAQLRREDRASADILERASGALDVAKSRGPSQLE